jgi:hypothetical protein
MRPQVRNEELMLHKYVLPELDIEQTGKPQKLAASDMLLPRDSHLITFQSEEAKLRPLEVKRDAEPSQGRISRTSPCT